MRYRFTPTAAKHMGDIWKYSKQHWGVARADRYIEDNEADVAKAAAGKISLRSRDEYGEGLFSLRSGSHVVFLCTARRTNW